jgi:hypothetical protein
MLRRRFTTAAQLATEVGVSRVNAYRILHSIARALRAEKVKLLRKRVRQGSTGPLAVAYRLP